MDRGGRDFGQRLRSILQVRAAQARSFAAAKLGALALRRLRAALIGTASVALLGLALDSAGAAGIAAWVREETPEPALLVRWAEKRGFRLLPPAEIPSSVWRSLPSRGVSDSPVWVSGDEEWVALYERAESPWGPRILCVGCRKKPEAWRDLGPGWEGVRSYARWAGAGPVQARPADEPRAVERRDPREFRY